MSEMDELVKEFLVESYDNLDQLDRDFVALEQDPSDTAILARIFRYIHTIKGTCGFLGFTKLEKVTHVGESLLSRLRDGELSLTPEMTSALLEMVDAVRQILGSIESDGGEGDGDYSAIAQQLSAHLTGGPAAPPQAAIAAPEAPAAAPEPKAESWRASPEVWAEAEAMATEAHAERAALATPPAAAPAEEATDDRPAWMASAEVFAEAEAMLEAAEAERARLVESAPKAAEDGAERTGGSVTDSSVRVDVVLLDKLMNLVGELVLARNQILQFTGGQAAEFTAAAQRLDLITSELQEGVMKTRMQPIGNIWSKFPRIVRDLSRSLDKRIRLEMEGKETELDKSLLEAIKDPLTHIIRNSIDHGIEKPDLRVMAGKPEEGVLHLRAFHEGGQVVIEIADDGGGIDAERVRDKAVEKGLLAKEQAARMSRHELLNLIWAPGFSTAKTVTNISGRGVGMDVVKTNIEKIGGSLDLQSEAGAGTTLRIKIPLTLAIIPALVVTCEGNRYAIPQMSLLELVRLESGHENNRIEHIHGTPVYRLRGRLLPIVYLREQLGKGAPSSNGRPGEESTFIVVVQAENRTFGLVVDEVHDTEEIVVKPLGRQIKGLTLFAGATIMGDGKVALILDIMGIAYRAGAATRGQEAETTSESEAAAHADHGERVSVLLFRSRHGGRMAIPLEAVARLEEFPVEHIEQSGHMDVVQYGKQILPLVRVSDLLEERRRAPREDEGGAANAVPDNTVQVIVYARDGRSVGLAVDEILDITEENVSAKGRASRDGVLYSAVIQGSVTEFLDIEAIIRKALPGFFGAAAGSTV